MAYLSIAISFFAVAIAFGQFWLAQTKLRVDMYDRRFEVFSSALDYYLALMFWRSPDEDLERQLDAQRRFVKALNEAPFLFTEKSGVHGIMQEMNALAGQTRGFKEEGHRVQSDPKVYLDWFNEVQTNLLKRLPDLIDRLRIALMPYLNVHYGGWLWRH